MGELPDLRPRRSRLGNLRQVTSHLRQRDVGGYQSIALQAETARRDCDFEEAIDTFQYERQRVTPTLELEHAYANALRDAGRYEEALTVYEKTLILPQDLELRWNKTLTELAMGRDGFQSFEHRSRRSPPPYLEYTPTTLKILRSTGSSGQAPSLDLGTGLRRLASICSLCTGSPATK